MKRWHYDLAAAGALALFVALLYAPLLFTNRVLASGDILLYFYPYRDYAAAALRGGEIPFWNPYIFLGVPFLANPQAAVLYPPQWLLSWLPVTKQIYWSAALHTWLLALGGYALLRRWGYGRWGALATGLALAGSGFYGGLMGHINQMNGAAWLPWLLWVLTGVDVPSTTWRQTARAASGVGLLVALMFLAGHTQTLYINLFGVGVWVIWPLVVALVQRRVRATWRQVARRLTAYAVGCGVALLAVAPQLLPTLELSDLGLRQGGLSYGEVSSFSLKPLKLPWTLLPTYGLVDLGVVFDTSGYSEYVAYIGLVALALAGWAAWRGGRQARSPAWLSGLLLAGLGLFLAAGRWNPAYFLLYRLVPGFDLFRAPARWMMLYTLGMAILAGIGLHALCQPIRHPVRISLSAPAREMLRRRLLGMTIARNWLAPLICGVIAVELLLAARSLPHTQPTAPQAVYDVRTAPAHLLTDPVRSGLHPAAAGRFLGMSTITFDPGDMADYARILREGPNPPLDAKAFEQLIIAFKVQELLAPNLALFWRLPGVDGFDGGVLPLGRYLDLLTLFVPRDELWVDGRLREQVAAMPSARLLGLLNIQYIITDKVRDLWFEDIYYDRQIGATLGPQLPTVIVDVPQPFPATHLHLIATVEGDAAALAGANRPVLEVAVAGNSTPARFTLTAGSEPGADLADAGLDSPVAAANGATVAYHDVEGGRQEYRVVLELGEIAAPQAITLTWATGAPPVTVQAATLVDARTGKFTPLLPSDRGRFRQVHSGDVKIYELLNGQPRAYLVPTIQAAASADEALTLLADPAFDPATVAVVEGNPNGLDSAANILAPDAGATITAYAPERVVIRTSSDTPALLVLSDTFYPGWQAMVDGAPAPIYRTNVLFRGVALPAGEHTVEFTYRPTGWTRGLWLGATGWLGLLFLWLGPLLRPRRASLA